MKYDLTKFTKQELLDIEENLNGWDWDNRLGKTRQF